MAKFKLRLLIPLLATTLLFGCDDGSENKIVSEQKLTIDKEVNKLKNQIDGRFIYYDEQSSNGNLYMKDIKTGCIYLNYKTDIRTGMTLVQGTCETN